MVHADASNFASNISKEEAYKQVLEQAETLFADQRNWVCNLANTASLLWHAYKSLPSPSNQVNWAGFYTLSPINPASTPQTAKRQHLILAPFFGKVACQTIALSPPRGVCGLAAATATTQLVQNVHDFPGHIACDSDSASEIVVPILEGGRTGGKVMGVIDVDCSVQKGFDDVDRIWLERLAELLGRACDWTS